MLVLVRCSYTTCAFMVRVKVRRSMGSMAFFMGYFLTKIGKLLLDFGASTCVNDNSGN